MAIALIGLLGTLVGFFITYFLNLRSERTKRELDKKLHFDEARAVAYAEFMAAAAKAFDEWLGYHNLKAKKDVKAETDAELESRYLEVRKTYHEAWTPFHKVKILGSKPVAMAAGVVWDVLVKAKRGELYLNETMGDAEDNFFRAAKLELELD